MKLNSVILPSNSLHTLLQDLNLLDNNAVFFRNKEDGILFPGFSDEVVKKLDIIKPDAYFVFNAQPYILFFDLSQGDERHNEDSIHKQVWSFDNSPLIFIVKETEIEIFNSFSFDKKQNRLQEIRLSTSERNERFSFWNLQSGECWKWLQEEHYKTTIQKRRVNQKLFENIKLVRETLTFDNQDTPLTEDEANILILRLIFVRYLIDRNVRMDTEYISGDTILARRKSFSDLIQKPRKLNQFFTQLNDKFNGVLFKDIKLQITKDQATYLSWVFNTQSIPGQKDLFEGQDFYFEIFDFSIIPVEVISGIYESLISEETRNEQSAVYTPAFLVDYILGETVDKYLNRTKGSECKIFDPSCGSGIFLVQSYRRMVDAEKKLYGNRIKKSRLKELAQNNLFGIDLNAQALKVTCFSIYIAILDYQDPKTILDNFHFPRLIDENLFAVDFFEQSVDHPLNNLIKNISFDFILGNPPWKKDKSVAHLNWINSTSIYSKKVDGGIEIAQSFLLRTKEFMNERTVSALIVTSMVFYNVSTTSKEFKNSFLSTFCLDRFFDLSPVRRLIFEEKSSPASIVSYRLANGNNYKKNIVRHTSVKSNIFLKYFKTLIVEKFDQKKIQQIHFIENEWMFKVALYGNTLDFTFLKRLETNKKKLLDVFDGKKIFKGAGIHKGTKDKYESFEPIIGKTIIENSEIQKYYSISPTSKVISKAESYIKSGREEGLFNGKQILIKEQAKNESEIVVSLTDNSYVIRSGVFSLSTETEIDLLRCIYAYLITDIYEYFVFITSGSWGVSTRPQIRLDDEYLTFPFIDPSKRVKEQLAVLVDEFTAPAVAFYQDFTLGTYPISLNALERINEVVNCLYGINGFEKDLVNYVLGVSRYQFQESKQAIFSRKVDADRTTLLEYADVFVQEFARIYPDENMTVEVYPMTYFIAINFVFNSEQGEPVLRVINEETDESVVLKKIASSLSISKITSSKDNTKNIYLQKDIKGFEPNSFYIIKPNEYKCWHRAIAWYDLAEVRETIEAAEYELIKNSANGI